MKGKARLEISMAVVNLPPDHVSEIVGLIMGLTLGFP